MNKAGYFNVITIIVLSTGLMLGFNNCSQSEVQQQEDDSLVYKIDIESEAMDIGDMAGVEIDNDNIEAIVATLDEMSLAQYEFPEEAIVILCRGNEAQQVLLERLISHAEHGDYLGACE